MITQLFYSSLKPNEFGDHLLKRLTLHYVKFRYIPYGRKSLPIKNSFQGIFRVPEIVVTNDDTLIKLSNL